MGFRFTRPHEKFRKLPLDKFCHSERRNGAKDLWFAASANHRSFASFRMTILERGAGVDSLEGEGRLKEDAPRRRTGSSHATGQTGGLIELGTRAVQPRCGI